LLALSDHRELWLAGPKSIEVWYNSGAELFPFARIDGAFIPHGIVSAQCMFKADNTVAWVGQDDQGKGMIWKASGYQPQRISTYAIEQEIAKYRTLSDCVGWSYQQDGHTYGVWNFPSGNATWVYDFSTQLWHQWAYTGEQGLERARPDMHSRAFGKHIVTDWLNGNVYELDPLTLNDNGTSITKQRVAPYIADELKNLIISKFQLDVQTGFAEDVGSIHGGGQVTDVAVTEVYVNANGAAYFGVSRPLGANFQGVLWSSYTLISSLPSDAVIQGIYPVIIGSGTVDWAESLWQYGTNLSLYNTGGNAFHHPFNPHTQTFTSTEFWDASIGTSLSALSNQTIKMVLNSSIFQNNVHDTAFCTGCGFAIYYTSATPITDPQMPAPFAVPAGQGLAWALPLVATDTDGSTSSYVKITQSQITSNVVTFTADPSAGYVPVVGDLLRGVVGTTIDGGALNDGGFVTVSAATSTTFSYAW
jgi:hypothetical protein